MTQTSLTSRPIQEKRKQTASERRDAGAHTAHKHPAELRRRPRPREFIQLRLEGDGGEDAGGRERSLCLKTTCLIPGEEEERRGRTGACVGVARAASNTSELNLNARKCDRSTRLWPAGVFFMVIRRRLSGVQIVGVLVAPPDRRRLTVNDLLTLCRHSSEVSGCRFSDRFSKRVTFTQPPFP